MFYSTADKALSRGLERKDCTIVMLFLLFRLVGCNIIFMKRFLPLLMLTGLLFGQDVLLHKSGKNYKGIFLGKVDEKIIFKIEGEKSNSAFSINDVDIVITSRGGIKVELYYPFDIETIIEEDKSGFGKRASEAYLAGNQDEFLRQNTKPCLWGPWGLLKLFVIFTILMVTVGEENMP